MVNDSELIESGLTARGAGRVLVLACGALAREILAITKNWDHVDLQCLPAILHNHPDRIPAAVEEALIQHKGSYHSIFVAYGDCGTGGRLKKVCDRHGVSVIAGPHCYSFFEGNDTFAQRDEMTAFFLTDFLARQFDAFVWRPLGLDEHPELRDMYFGNYEKLVFLAQSNNDVLTAKAQEAATRMGLAFERRYTGFGDLTPALSQAAQA